MMRFFKRFEWYYVENNEREKEQYDAGNIQKWTKAGSLRRGQRAMLKQSFSQSHESLAVQDDPSSGPKLITANSVNNVAAQAGVQARDHEAGRVAGWAVNFDRLLKDSIGLTIFTDFLKKEFSEENIIFWIACEQYRQLEDEHTRKQQAQEIYSRHLSSKASDPVNVDSAAKSYTEKFLENPTAAMFDVAQQHIFQLMRQDSYARFLKSELYKDHLMREMEGQPLHDPTANKNPPTASGKGDKKKGKGKENEEKRRRSILPWKQSKKSSIKGSSEADLKKLGKKTKEEKSKEKDQPSEKNVDESEPNPNFSMVQTLPVDTVNTSINGGPSFKALGPGIDLSTMRKEVFHPKETQEVTESQFKFCRIMLPDGSTTVVCAKPGQTCRYVLSKLCEKRSVSLASVDIFILGSNKPLDLDEDISILGSKEIVIEKRVLFRLDLPNSRSIGVKAKPNRTANDVFQPILLKYGFNMEDVAIHLHGEQEVLDLEQPVSNLDNERVVISTNDDFTGQGVLLGSRSHKAAPASKGRAGRSGGGVGSLEEITNQIFEDLMRGKSQLAHGFDELGVMELDKAKANHKNGGGRSLGLLGLLRRESLGAKDKTKKSKGKVTFALPKTEAKKSKEKDGEHLMQLLSGAQSLRLEDQRGVERAAGDMPSFLFSENREVTNKVMEVHLHQDGETRNGTPDIFTESSHRSRGVMNNHHPTEQWMTPRSSSMTPRMSSSVTPKGQKPSSFWSTAREDKRADLDGMVPSTETAERHQRMSPVVIDTFRMAQSVDETLKQETNRLSPSRDSNRFERSVPRTNSGESEPVHSTSHGNFSTSHSMKAPAVSPERFSPQNKKPRSNIESDLKGAPVTSLLPNKISPTPCSFQSQSTSSSHVLRNPSSSVTTSVSSYEKDMSRLSDQDRRQRKDHVDHQTVLNNRRGQNQQKKHHQGQRPTDLVQRALLSPRFEDNSQNNTSQDLTVKTIMQHALLSPRLSPSRSAQFYQSQSQSSSVPPHYTKHFSNNNNNNNNNQMRPVNTSGYDKLSHMGVPFSTPIMSHNKYSSSEWECKNVSAHSHHKAPTESIKQKLSEILDSGEGTVTFV